MRPRVVSASARGMRFWRLEVPFAMPPLIWNMMMSMSGGWFFVVASEAITVGNTTVTLPGVGSYVALAVEQRNLHAIAWAIAAMFVVILIYDQLLFRPLIAGADWFRLEQEAGLTPSHSWALTMMRRSRFLGFVARAFASILNIRAKSRTSTVIQPRRASDYKESKLGDFLWYALIGLIGIIAVLKAVRFIFGEIAPNEVWHVVLLGLLTLFRVGILIALASVIWVPIGIFVGLRPRVTRIVQPIAQFLAAFPVILLFPIVVSGIVILKLNPDIWLSPLMILGTQWYILFNVIVGASAIPIDLRYAGDNFHVRGWLWWKRGRAARRVSVLRNRGHHGVRGLLERQRRFGGRYLGQGEAHCTRARGVHIRRDHRGRLPSHRARYRGDGAVRCGAEPFVLEAVVPASRA